MVLPVALLFVFCSPALLWAEPPSPFAIEQLISRPVPEFTLKDLYGVERPLTSYRGKVVVLYFWASWSPPADSDFKSLEELRRRLANRGLVVVAVSVDREFSAARRFLEEHAVTFPVLLDLNGTVSQEAFKLFMVPTVIIIDRKGAIVERCFGEQNWQDGKLLKEIEQLL